MTETSKTSKSRQATALVASYFDQDQQYYSTSRGAMTSIAEMAPTYAANAAERLLREARAWAADAGVTERPGSWMAETALFKALRARATAAPAPEVDEFRAFLETHSRRASWQPGFSRRAR